MDDIRIDSILPLALHRRIKRLVEIEDIFVGNTSTRKDNEVLDENELKLLNNQIYVEARLEPKPLHVAKTNWIQEFCQNIRKDRIKWNSKLHRSASKFSMKSMYEQVEDLMDISADDFAKCINKLTDDEEHQLSKEMIKKLFSIEIEHDISHSLFTQKVQKPFVSQEIAEMFECPELCIERNVRRLLEETNKSKPIKPKYHAFGRSLSPTSRKIQRIKFSAPEPFDFPEDIRSGAKLFKGIDHLKSTKALLSYLDGKNLPKPKYLVAVSDTANRIVSFLLSNLCMETFIYNDRHCEKAIEMFGKPKLPLLPGFVICPPKERHHLSQCWTRINGTNLHIEKKQADINWILNDRKILCFKAYFRQDIPNTDTFQIRRVKVLFYMEDGTIQTTRAYHKGVSNKYLTQWDLNVQMQVSIFDRIYTLTDCDKFTRTYLSRAGVKVPEPIQTPKDPIHVTREQMVESSKEKQEKPQQVYNKLEKFLKFDNCCLKFDGYWDDRNSPSGDIHDLVIYYYLADDTIQINDIPKRGRPVILYKRLKLPKKTDDVLLINQKTSSTILNVLGRDFMHAHCIPDRLSIGKPNIDCYSDQDLSIGQSLNVFGRVVVLTDCDKFTREYYQKKYGIEEFVPIPKPKDMFWQHSCIERIMPPYNGWGSYEDSEASCNAIQLKAPHRDMKKFLELDNCNLRFQAKMISNIDEDSDRDFLITYYLSDDTISVFENGQRNANSSRDFLKRAKFYLPNQNVYTSCRPELYTSSMLYIGAMVHFNGFEFHLTDADEFTLRHMESHDSQYPMANISSIMSKIKDIIRPIYKEFIGKYLGVAHLNESSSHSKAINICFDTTAAALRDLLGNNITEHEIVTFLRYFKTGKSSNESKVYNRSTIQSMVQMALNNRLWDDVDKLKEFIYDFDPDNHNGFMPPAKLWTIVKGCRLPIKDILIKDMFEVLNKDGNGAIDINDFLYFIDCKRCKAPPIQPINPYCDGKKAFNEIPQLDLVDWSLFIAELGLEIQLRQQTD